MSVLGQSMDDLLPKLLAFPPHPPPQTPLSDFQYDEGIRNQISTVGKIPEKNLLPQTSGGENALDVINPAINTVPYIYILLAHINAAQKGNKGVNWDTLWAKIANFLETFDGRQIRYLGKEFTQIIETAVTLARSNNQSILAIGPIRTALLRLDPSGSILTSTHLHLVELALEARDYETVLPVIDKFIYHFPGATNQPRPKFLCELGLSPTAYITPESKLTAKLNHQDVLEYFMYSGMVYIGLRKWESALECLENAITYPAKDVSKIMVEAYKKWILVGLLLEGKPLNLPKSTSSSVAKSYHVVAKPYETVAQIFETGTASRLKAEVEAGQKIWQADCNMGLMLSVLSAYQKFQIRNLADIYSKISIPEVNNLTMSAETGGKLQSPALAEQLVQSMISEGSLNATLSHPPNGPAILTFGLGAPIMTEDQMQKELQASKQRIQFLTQEIKTTDRLLTYDKEYVKYMQKLKKNAKNGVTDQGISGPDMDWNPIEDEDIMAGVF